MPTQEHQPTDTNNDSETGQQQEQGVAHERRHKTLAVRIDEDLHTQLRFIAQLSDTNITEEIRRAIADRISAAQEDPKLIARAQHAQQAIEREAAARSAAIAGFIGKPATDATVEAAPSGGTTRRRSAPSNK